MRSKTPRHLYLTLGVAAMAAGCASSKGLEAPAPPVSFAAEPATDAPLADAAWVTGFDTPELEAYVREALGANPSLAAAEARADAARLRARASFGRWLPDFEIGGSAARVGTPDATGERINFDTITARATASWEADLWGRLLDNVRATGADARAQEADYAAARLSVAGQTAIAWIDLAESLLLQQLAREDLETRERVLEITERRYARGLTDALSVRTARSQTAFAEASLAAQNDAVLVAARRLETLTGRYPAADTRTQAPLPTLAPIAAPGAPADLLSRRPDVAASEARLRAAGLRVSAARKALLPRLTLSASLSGTEGQLAEAIDPERMVSNLVAGLVQPIFQGGALRAEANAAAADARAAAANYVQTALDAWTEVEGALSADATLALREEQLERAFIEAREAQALAERQYAGGVATIFELIDAYSRRIEAERSLIAARAQRVTNRISYHVALGGGADTGGLTPPPGKQGT